MCADAMVAGGMVNEADLGVGGGAVCALASSSDTDGMEWDGVVWVCRF